MNNSPRLSLGPILFFWPRDDIYAFYRQAAEMPVDIIYLGETVCSKRRSLRTEEWIELARELSKSTDKEIVLSTLSLLEAESELKTLRRICENGEFLVEANDIAGVQILSRLKVPFTTGPSVNIYNPETLKLLINKGLKRWVLPVELSKTTLVGMLKSLPSGTDIETEIFAYGKLPLTLSARCFTARSHNLPKDDCQYKCIDYPDGRLLSTQEKDPFLALNGIQTVSAQTCNLIGEIGNISACGGDILRISPQHTHMQDITSAFAKSVRGEEIQDISSYSSLGVCNGYWHGESGFAQIPANQ